MKKCKWLAEFEGICCNADCKYYEIEEKCNEINKC